MQSYKKRFKIQKRLGDNIRIEERRGRHINRDNSECQVTNETLLSYLFSNYATVNKIGNACKEDGETSCQN